MSGEEALAAQAPRVRFDPTVNLGHLLTFAGFVAAALGAWYGVKAEIGGVSLRLESAERELAKTSAKLDGITHMLVSDARQDELLKVHDRQIDTLDRRLAIIERGPHRAPAP